MQRHEMIEAMRALGLKGMAGAFDEAVTTGVQRKRTIAEILADLLRAEAAHRHAASIRYRMSAAKLPVVGRRQRTEGAVTTSTRSSSRAPRSTKG